MSDERTTATVHLSQEELVFILRRTIINTPNIPGLGILPLGETDPETENLLLDAAGRALIAREFITLDENNMPQIDPGVLAAVSVCAHPQQMVSMIYQNGQETAQQYYFYRVPELAVTHTLPSSGLHNFEISATSDMGSSLLQTLLDNVPKDSPTTSTYEIDQQILAQAQETSTSEHGQEAQEIFIATGIAPNQAKDFAETLASPQTRLMIQIIYQPPPDAKQEILTLLANDNLWLIRAEHPNAPQVNVTRLSFEHIQQVCDQIYLQLAEHTKTWQATTQS